VLFVADVQLEVIQPEDVVVFHAHTLAAALAMRNLWNRVGSLGARLFGREKPDKEVGDGEPETWE
jgi:hypothetical protein